MAAVSLRPTTHLMIQWFHYSMWLSATGMIQIRPFTIAINISRAMRRLTGGQTLIEVQCFGWRCDDPREMEHVVMCYMTSSAWGALARIPKMTKHHRKARYKQGNPSGNLLYSFENICKYTHMHTHKVLYACHNGSVPTYSKQCSKTATQAICVSIFYN